MGRVRRLELRRCDGRGAYRILHAPNRKADETFPAVADILAMGRLLALFEKKLPVVKWGWAVLMTFPVVLIPTHGCNAIQNNAAIAARFVARIACFDCGAGVA